MATTRDAEPRVMPAEAAVADAADAAFAQALQGLPLEGAERSFKMGQGSLLAQRYLAGVRREALAIGELIERCERLSIPAAYLEAIVRDAPQADTVHFGYEAGEGGCIYKVYLEFWQRLNNAPTPAEAVVLHLAYKWDAADAARCAVSTYRCYPGQDVTQMQARMQAVYGAQMGSPSLEAAREVVAAAARHTRERLMYLEVSEAGNPRASFDIRLYPAHLRLADVHPQLLRASRAYGVGDAFDALYAQQRTSPLGHVSGGLDRQGRDFLTVYTPVQGGA